MDTGKSHYLLANVGAAVGRVVGWDGDVVEGLEEGAAKSRVT